MIHYTNIRTVPAVVLALLLPCCVCSCAYRDGLKSLGTPGDLLTCAQDHHASRAIPCDPCYGYHPTCWSAWPDCCPNCPPPSGVMAEGVTEGGRDMPSPNAPSPRELVPTPYDEPPVAKPPEATRVPPSRLPATMPPDAPLPPRSTPPAPEPPNAPLPPPQKDGAGTPSQGVERLPPPRQGVTVLPPPPVDVMILPPPPSVSEDTGDRNVLTALRRAISSQSPRPRPLGIQADPRLGRTNSPRTEETTLIKCCHYEPLSDHTYGNSTAASFSQDFIEP
jgi:hypothetical protein